MKYIIVLALIAIVVVANVSARPEDAKEEPNTKREEYLTKAKQYIEDCAVEGKLSDEDKLKIKNQDFEEANETIKCFAHCFFEKTGAIKDNKIQQASVLEKLTVAIGAEKAQQVVDRCSGLEDENKCETAFKVYRCYENAKSELVA